MAPTLDEKTEQQRTADAVRQDPTMGYWAAPLLLVLALFGISGLIWWFAERQAEQARVEVSEPAAKTVGTTGIVAGKFTRVLPGNVLVLIPATGSAEDRLSMYLASASGGSTTITFDRIGFESGSARLTPDSRDQIDNVATILRAYPRTIVTVAGYADNVGNESANLALSRARAAAVAERLTDAGIESDRVHSEGYGSRTPVADNSTESGRAQNRRVALEVAVQ